MDYVLTVGVLKLPKLREVMQKVASYTDFPELVDPYGDHEF